MSDLPKAVEDYFKNRGKDPAELDYLPKTKDAFKNLTKLDQDSIDMLNKLGKAIEKDLDDGHHVGDEVTDALTPEEKVHTYLYAIH
jgi:hypothetical protein